MFTIELRKRKKGEGEERKREEGKARGKGGREEGGRERKEIGKKKDIRQYIFHKISHIEIVCIRSIKFAAGKFRIMGCINSFISVLLSNLKHSFYSSNNKHLESGREREAEGKGEKEGEG